MNYLKLPKKIFPILCLALLSQVAQADINPHKAVYNLYSKGFHIGEVTQIVKQQNNSWSINLTTEARGLARFIIDKAATNEQVFNYNDQSVNLISAKSDAGTSKKDSKHSALLDLESKQITMHSESGAETLPIQAPILSYLTLPFIISGLELNSKQTVTIYDKGKLKTKIIEDKGIQELSFDSEPMLTHVVDVYSNNSNKLSRYYFKPESTFVPFRIERIKEGKVKIYLELESLKVRS